MMDIKEEYVQDQLKLRILNKEFEDMRKKKKEKLEKNIKPLIEKKIKIQNKIQKMEFEYHSFLDVMREDRRKQSTKVHESKKKIEEMISFLSDNEIESVPPDISENCIVNWLDLKHPFTGYCEPLDTIFNEENMKIRAFIIENEQPKRKYSLTLLISSLRHILPRQTRETRIKWMPYIDETITEGTNLDYIIIKNHSKIDFLKEYYERNIITHKNKKILKLIEQYRNKELEREHILQNYTLEEFFTEQLIITDFLNIEHIFESDGKFYYHSWNKGDIELLIKIDPKKRTIIIDNENEIKNEIEYEIIQWYCNTIFDHSLFVNLIKVEWK